MSTFVHLTYHCFTKSFSEPPSSYSKPPFLFLLKSLLDPFALIPLLTFLFLPLRYFFSYFLPHRFSSSLFFSSPLVSNQFSTFLKKKFTITLQGCEASGSRHVKSQTGSVHLCTGVAVPKLLWAYSCLQPAHCQTSAAAHPATWVLQPRTACMYTHTHANTQTLVYTIKFGYNKVLKLQFCW